MLSDSEASSPADALRPVCRDQRRPSKIIRFALDGRAGGLLPILTRSRVPFIASGILPSSPLVLLIDDRIHQQRDALIQWPMLGQRKARVGLEQPLRLPARQFDELHVGQPRHLQPGQP